MIKNYLTIVFRNFWKNKVYFFINIVGLSVAIASCIIAYLNYRFDQDFNTFHPEYSQIFKINGVQDLRNTEQKISISPLPLGPQIHQENPNIESFCRFARRGGGLLDEIRAFNQQIAYVDENFLELFNFPLKYGKKQALNNKNQIILSEETAEKIFGDINPVGKSLRLRVGEDYYSTIVGGVLQEIPKNSSLIFDAITSFDNLLRHQKLNSNDWSSWVNATFIKVKSPDIIDQIEQSLSAYIPIQNENNPSIKLKAFYTSSLNAMSKDEHFLYHSIFMAGMEDTAIFGLIVSAFFTLLLASFNFVNTTLALSNKRLKEIGIRKVLGGTRQKLMQQFIFENLGLIFIAILGGLALAEVLIPSFNSIFTFLELKMSNLGFISWMILLPTLLLTVGLLAGFYPAFYLSNYEPVVVLKGKIRHQGVNTFSKVLLVLQLAFTAYNLIFGYSFYRNGIYQQSMDRGYAWEDLLLVPIDGQNQYQALKDKLQDNPKVSGVSAAVVPIGFRLPDQVIDYRGEEFNVGLLEVDNDYSETLGLNILEGKDLANTQNPESYRSILVNEALKKEFNWKNALGQRLKIGDEVYTVRGVIQDFFETNFMHRNRLRPVIMKRAEPSRYSYISVRTKQADLAKINNYLKEQWAEVSPNIPYEGFFQDRFRFDEVITTQIIIQLTVYFSIISLLITFLSLYTLVSLTIQQRMKEIGIRKILGASLNDIAYLLSQGYTVLLLAGLTLGSVGSYFALEMLMDMIYSYRLPSHWTHLVLPSLSLIFIAFATVSYKIYRTAMVNPILYLRDE